MVCLCDGLDIRVFAWIAAGLGLLTAVRGPAPSVEAPQPRLCDVRLAFERWTTSELADLGRRGAVAPCRIARIERATEGRSSRSRGDRRARSISRVEPSGRGSCAPRAADPAPRESGGEIDVFVQGWVFWSDYHPYAAR